MELVDRALSGAQPKSIAAATTSGLHSTLPMDIDKFRTIVCGFVEILPDMMVQLRQAWESRNFEELHALAHKLKGTGGTVGFSDFTAPAARLQDNADVEIEEGTEELLLTIEALAASVVAPAPV
jgi:HPt (histidine-containing phosphotransfer) domain-containing protein